MKCLAAIVASAAILTMIAAVPAPAWAQTTTDFSTGTPDGAQPMDGGIGTGQVFTVPAGVTHLTSAALGVAYISTPDAYSLRLYRYSSGAVGALVDSSAETIGAGSAYPAYEMDTLTLSGAGLPVTPGEQFVIVGYSAVPLNAAAVLRGGNFYLDGGFFDGFGESSGNEGFFRATYTDAAPAPVPTLSEWAMILFGTVLAGGAALYIQRRRMVA
ncbi:IPTL-CTERM sorting domain-containing protein [Brevundimonas staleyi]|uniref:IPTL-CTERM sorting domain-containing protein n=1 Tax=Brevundimonas staleyi TaxID=74326 RepID=A0ABW0FPH1_9CAUL